MSAAAPTSFSARLLGWFDHHGRHDLPWQRPATPYRVWVSEIMLQQTRVETVRDYFERFMARFPDLATLAAADLDEVLALWSGLGYYARARNLHRAARQVRADHGGELPRDLPNLMALPGIGRSTAAAILSLGAGERHAILDGNVKRVLARHAGIGGWPGRAAVQRALWQEAEARTPHTRSADYNQAMMDLGALVCRRRPACDVCPVAADCIARAQGTTATLPAPKPQRALARREVVVLVLQRHDDGAILLERRPPHGIWGGLWSLPEFSDEAGLREWLATRCGDAAWQTLASVEHAFTHFRLRIHPRLVQPPAAHAIAEADQTWYDGARLDTGLPAPIRRLLDPLAGAGTGTQ